MPQREVINLTNRSEELSKEAHLQLYIKLKCN
jgi:hypothetical protein